jgi:hypothetical protein
MAGRKGRSGRKRGARSWTPTSLAAQHLSVLIEYWLAGVLIRIGERYIDGDLEQPTSRRYTVPPEIKRALAELAIKHVRALYPRKKQPELTDVMAHVWRKAPPVTLRRKRRERGPSDGREAAFQDKEKRLEAAWKPLPHRAPATDIDGLERRPPPPLKVFPSMLVDVFNPSTSKRVRIIYPMATPDAIGIEPGQKLRNVRMALHVIEQLRAQDEAELKLHPHSINQPLVITEVAGGGALVTATAVEADA